MAVRLVLARRRSLAGATWFPQTCPGVTNLRPSNRLGGTFISNSTHSCCQREDRATRQRIAHRSVLRKTPARQPEPARRNPARLSLDRLEKGSEGIEGQLRSMRRCFRQAFDGPDKFLSAQLARLREGSSLHQFGQSRTAGHSRNAPLCTKADLGDAPAFNLDRESQNIAARRIFDFDGRIRIGNFASVARVFKIIEQSRRVHITQF